MAKWSLKNRILHLRVSSCITFILCLIAFIQIFARYGVYNYTSLPEDVLQTQLYKQITPTLVLKKGNPDCTYDDILKNTHTTNPWDIPIKFNDFSANGVENGSYVPTHCNPLFSVAIIVTYRNRQSQLDVFLPYMHNFLRKQNIHYKIFLVEQQDEKLFNKGMLYNIGVKQALAEKFPCVILHDVDLLPLDAANLYVCAESPRHMSAAIDKFRNVLPYSYLVGGVLAIKTDQYVKVNGFSHRYEGWGGEDDDFAFRLSHHDLEVIRFPRRMSRYTMLTHIPERKNELNARLLNDNRHDTRDGLAAAPPVRAIPHRLFTLLGVHL